MPINFAAGSPGRDPLREGCGSHVALLGAVLLLMVPLSFKHYLLFHTLAEMVSIVIAIAAFAVAWSAYPFSRNHFLMYVGIVLFWSSALDMVHALLYKGMNIFEDIGANPATEVWIATRYLQASALLLAPLFLTRPLRRLAVFVSFGVLAAALLAASYSGIFPDAYVEGEGLTTFKVASEYVIVALFGAGIAALWLRRRFIDHALLVIVGGAIALLMAAELAFTVYADVYGLSNMVGHALKVSGYWLFYWALVGFTVEQPFRTMARSASTYDAVPEAIVVVDRDGVVREANRAALAAAPGCVGDDWHARFHPRALARADCPLCAALERGSMASGVELSVDGAWHEFTLSPVRRRSETSGMVQVCRDVTKRKEAERRLRDQLEELRRFQRVSIGRELRMQELEGDIRRLEIQLAAAGARR